MSMGADEVPGPGQPVPPPPPLIAITGQTLDVGPARTPDGQGMVLVGIRNPVAAAQIPLTLTGVDELIETLRQAQAAAGGTGLAVPETGLFDANGRRLA